jgi:hypothetical protein
LPGEERAQRRHFHQIGARLPDQPVILRTDQVLGRGEEQVDGHFQIEGLILGPQQAEFRDALGDVFARGEPGGVTAAWHIAGVLIGVLQKRASRPGLGEVFVSMMF